MTPDTEQAPRRDGLSNILRNLAWILGGKGFGAICSFFYLAILARSLGMKDFGHFSLIFGTAQALVAVAGFQTWQTLVRYGARHVVDRHDSRFGRLIWFCASADILGAITGCLVAAILYFGFSSALELNPAYVVPGFLFACALMWSRLTTPSGIVRVLDRFDVGMYIEAIIPTGRLIASGIILATGASVVKFLFAWAFFDLLSGLLYWIVAARLAPDAFHWRNFGQFRQMLDENTGVRGFFGVTYMATTLDAVVRQGPLLAVGFFLGTSAAGLYRLADQLAVGAKQFTVLVARAVLPEFAMSRMSDAAHDFTKLVRRISAIAALAGVSVLLLAIFAGEPLLVLIGGSDYARGAVVLVPLAVGAGFELASVAYEPMLYSTGHARYALLARLLSVAALAIAVPAFVFAGPTGVGWAVAVAMGIFYLAMSVIVWIILRKLRTQGDTA
ncbi:lipopolysaccharide biosynthesis protein [Aurantiacibacter rhizosphaerae]|uniref:Oligosaccharide flippase family protein n=1 Tax=Aurantiacibacter rhizosphaerae TaxID=2691582 RepID=A0A844XDY1_9SPHN|nr:lipopolysaccharide biosynthesis protein [Aurantiacibacter rhizosphaerae]MWV27882.1 oligosaccharide flippase family protein [Aurantiacibacter rhizosphaerae]